MAQAQVPSQATQTGPSNGSAPPSPPTEGHASAVQTPQRTASASTEQQKTEVPDPPQIAPNIKLSGVMEESGFAEPQWMVQRDGQFVNLTELLYHVAEQVDGKRTLDQIAEGVSEKTDRKVTVDNVQQLIASKLIPLGIVSGADGKSVTAAAEGVARSPLKLNAKTKVLPAALITPLTNVLKVLYFPPVLIAVLLVCAASQVWLFFVHGVAASVREAANAPWQFLVVLLIIVVGTAWHEFGHAAALEYGGGKVREMGAGFYLVYPAFYTNVTDNYRLGRWARVRTDLGGFYFNLIFSFGLMGLYLLTRQDFLLLAVLLTDIDILHQCLPFVRLDGYWTLADVTGIPDFFSYIGPFVRSVLPIPALKKGKTMPALKPWAKVVFALYIIITVPLLLFLIVVMLKSVPHILATAWESFGKQRVAFADALGKGQVLGVVFATVQMLLLALPIAGLCFTLFTLGKGLLGRLWTWAKPTAGRRLVATATTAAFAALLLFFWVPGIPTFQTQAKGKPAPAAQSNWQPIATAERGTVFDAAPAFVPVPYRSPDVPAATVASTISPATAPAFAASPASTPNPATNTTPTVASTPIAATSTVNSAVGTGTTTAATSTVNSAVGTGTTTAATSTTTATETAATPVIVPTMPTVATTMPPVSTPTGASATSSAPVATAPSAASTTPSAGTATVSPTGTATVSTTPITTAPTGTASATSVTGTVTPVPSGAVTTVATASVSVSSTVGASPLAPLTYPVTAPVATTAVQASATPTPAR